MIRALILALTLVLLVIFFALQNSKPVSLTFLFWTFKSPLSLIITIVLFVGGLFGILFSFPTIMKKNKTINKLKNKKGKEEKNKKT
jgi:putative membrane protein